MAALAAGRRTTGEKNYEHAHLGDTMKLINTRSIAAVLALVITATGLKGIATLAHVDGHPMPLVTLPTVQVVATKPVKQDVAEYSTDAGGRI
jgi:hypothetical protein